jgi:hypothetical protein
MNTEKLSELYSYSTQEIQKLTTELYENLHESSGAPVSDWKQLLDMAREYKRLVIIELESMKAALKEYNEVNDD